MDMNVNGLFGETISTLGKSLDLRSVKHNTIVSNITNSDTPGYHSFDLVFEDEIQKITGASHRVGMRKTHKGHFPVGSEAINNGAAINNGEAMDNIEYKIEKPPMVNLRGDANTVDIDREMSKLSENSLMYNASAQILSKKFQLLKSVIRGGGG